MGGIRRAAMGISRGDKKRNLNFIMSFIRTFDVLNRYLELELFKYKTSPIRFAVMNAMIVHGGQMTPTAISKWTYRSPRTITSMLDSLEQDGLIRREPNTKDRRSINAVVTEKGWEHTSKLIPAVDRIDQRALSCLSEDELNTLNNIHKKLRKHVLVEIDKSNAGTQ